MFQIPFPPGNPHTLTLLPGSAQNHFPPTDEGSNVQQIHTSQEIERKDDSHYLQIIPVQTDSRNAQNLYNVHVIYQTNGQICSDSSCRAERLVVQRDGF